MLLSFKLRHYRLTKRSTNLELYLFLVEQTIAKIQVSIQATYITMEIIIMYPIRIIALDIAIHNFLEYENYLS